MLRPPTDPYQSKAEQLIETVRLSKSNWPSEPALRAIEPRTVVDLLDLIVHKQESLLQGECGLTCYILITLLSLIFAFVGNAPFAAVPAVVSFAMGTVVYAGQAAQAPRLRCAVYALTQTNDLRVLSTLILITRRSWGHHPAILEAIERLLDTVTEADAGLLSLEAEESLWNLGLGIVLTSLYFNEQLALRTLRAIALIGGRNMLPQIRSIARYSPQSAPRKRLVQAAQQLLPTMEARLQQQEAPETLLRATTMPTPQPETLLRASLPSPMEPENQLLRADTSESSRVDT